MKKIIFTLIIALSVCFAFSACNNSTVSVETVDYNDATTILTTYETTDEIEPTEDDSEIKEDKHITKFSESFEGEFSEFVDFIIPEGFNRSANGDMLQKYNLMTDISDTVFFQNDGTDIIVKFDQNVIIEETDDSYNSTVEQVTETMKYVYPDIIINCNKYINENNKLIATVIADSSEIKYGFLVCEIADSLLTISCNSTILEFDEIENIINEIGDTIEEL